MRIGEKTNVEHEVGLARQAVAIGERQHGDGELVVRGLGEVADHDPTQIARRQLRGVDHQIGPVTQGRHEDALLGDTIGDPAVLGERVAPAGFGEATPQDLFLAIEEEHAKVRSAPLQKSV